MRAIKLCFALILFSSTISLGQRHVLNDSWQMNTIGFNGGAFIDFHPSLSMDWMKKHTRDPQVLHLKDGDELQTIYGSVEGGYLGGSVSFNPLSAGGQANQNREIILSAGLISMREALISYEFRNALYEQNNIVQRTMFCLIDNEANMGAEYRVSKRLSVVNLFAGAGVQLGATFNPEMLIIRSQRYDVGDPVELAPGNSEIERPIESTTIDTYAGNMSVYSRVFVSTGLGFVIANHLEIGLRANFGVGQEYIPAAQQSYALRNLSVLSSARWHIPPFRTRKSR